MRHAREEALNALEPLLEELRKIDGLKEKSRGVFYRKSSAFLHFHEDPAGLFADIRTGEGFSRFRVNTAADRTALVERAKRLV